MKDFCYRARPNRGIVEALSKKTALDCLPDLDCSEEEFMALWDNLVLERNNVEKKKVRDEVRASKLSLSIDKIKDNKTTNQNKIGVRSKFKDLLDDNLFD